MRYLILSLLLTSCATPQILLHCQGCEPHERWELNCSNGDLYLEKQWNGHALAKRIEVSPNHMKSSRCWILP